MDAVASTTKEIKEQECAGIKQKPKVAAKLGAVGSCFPRAKHLMTVFYGPLLGFVAAPILGRSFPAVQVILERLFAAV